MTARQDDDSDDEPEDDGPLPLTLENVERVLDKMRPYLMSDGGNVKVAQHETRVANEAVRRARRRAGRAGARAP